LVSPEGKGVVLKKKTNRSPRRRKAAKGESRVPDREEERERLREGSKEYVVIAINERES